MEEDDPAAGPDDPFAQLLDPGFVAAASVREPSAEDRAREVERRARAEALRQRLAEEAEHERHLAERDRRTDRRVHRKGRALRLLGPLAVLAVVGGVLWFQLGGGALGRGVLGGGAAGGGAAGGGAAGAGAARPEGYPPVDESASATPLGTPPPAPVPAGPFEFMAVQERGSGPVAWDPCRPVRYVINPAGAPPGSEALVRAAIDRTAAATGLRFVDAGTTDEPWSKDREPYQPDRYGERWAPVLISWSDQAATPGLAGYVAGMGGGIARSDVDGRLGYVSGGLVLDAADLGAALAAGGAVEVQAVIQHELGHVMGLDHVADPAQLMFTEGGPAQATDWGSGDLAGLHALGSGRCLPDL